MAILTGNARAEYGKVVRRTSISIDENIEVTLVQALQKLGTEFHNSQFRLKSIEFQTKGFDDVDSKFSIYGRRYEVRSIGTNNRNII